MQTKPKILSSILVSILLVSTILLFVNIPEASATTILSSGFEDGDGFASWDGKLYSYAEWTPTIVNTPTFSGTNASKCTNTGGISAVYKNVTATSHIFVRTYVNFADYQSISWSGRSVIKLTNGTNALAEIGMANWGSGNVWFLSYNDLASVELVSSPTPSINTQYSIELEYLNGTSSNGEVRLYVNDVCLKNITGVTLAPQITQVIVGSVAFNSGGAEQTIYVDDTVIADAKIGLASDTKAPTYSTLTTNSTVNATVCNFTALLGDNWNLANYTFGSNNTGTWVNASVVNISGQSYLANATLTLNVTVGNVVQWEFWFADTANNLYNTGVQSLEITASVATWTKTYLGGNNDLTIDTWLGVSTSQIKPFGIP